MGIIESVDATNEQLYYSIVPETAPFAAEAAEVVRTCLPYWLNSSSGHFRKNHLLLFNQKRDNTIGHVLPGLKSYFDDCRAGLATWNRISAMSFGLHDAIEDFDDFADQEAINNGLAPNRYLLEQMLNEGIDTHVLAIVLTSSKNPKAPPGDKYYRDRNLLNSLSNPLTSPEKAAPDHFRAIATRLFEYGYITSEEILEWENRFANSIEGSTPEEAYLSTMSEARKVKLRDRYQSISEDLTLVTEAIRQGRHDISTMPYSEKTLALITKMYGGIDISDSARRQELIFANTIDEEEVLLFERLRSLIQNASKYELTNIFEGQFLNENNYGRVVQKEKLLKENIYGGEEISSYLHMAILLKDFVSANFLEFINNPYDIQSGSVLGNMVDRLQSIMPKIFTKERINSIHFIYAMSVIISEGAVHGNVSEWLESLRNYANGNAAFFENGALLNVLEGKKAIDSADTEFIKKLKTCKLQQIDLDKAYTVMEKYDLEGTFNAAFDCYLGALYSNDVRIIWQNIHELRYYFAPILESVGFGHISQRFEDLFDKFGKQGSFVNYLDTINNHVESFSQIEDMVPNRSQLIHSINTIRADQSGFFELVWKKRQGILRRIVNGILGGTDQKAIVYSKDQWERLLNLGVGVGVVGESKNPYMSALIRA